MTLLALELRSSRVGRVGRALPAAILTMFVWACSSAASGDAANDGGGGTSRVTTTGSGGNDAATETLQQDAAAGAGGAGPSGSAGDDAAGQQGGSGSGGTAGDADADRTCPPFPKFPDESCTGVPAGYALTKVTGDLATTNDGQVIDGKEITGNLLVKHKRVTVTRSRVKGRVEASDNSSLVLRDVDLGPDACPTANNGGNRLIAANAGYTLVRGHLHNNGDDVLRAGGGDPIVIQDSLIHHTCYYPNDHLDALQFYDPGGVGHVTVAHSVLDVRPANSTDLSNAAIFWADTPGAGSTLTVSESLLAGGGVTLAAYDSGANSGVKVSVHDTRFVRNSFDVAACGLGNDNAKNHSPTIPFNGKEGLEWQGNAYDDGTPLPTCQ